jgi:hypothetical protein
MTATLPAEKDRKNSTQRWSSGKKKILRRMPSKMFKYPRLKLAYYYIKRDFDNLGRGFPVVLRVQH